MSTRSPERLVFFSDAVVAIALTLLILPLTDVVTEVKAANGPAIEVITEHQAQVWCFLLSFAVIARLWIGHHRLYEQVKAYSNPLMLVNLCWLLTIAVLPFPTEMIGQFGTDLFTVLFYIGTMVVRNATQTAM